MGNKNQDISECNNKDSQLGGYTESLKNICNERLKDKNTNKISLCISSKMILIGIVIGALFWILESIIHVFIFRKGNLVEQMFTSDWNEIWMRLLVVGILIIFAIYAQFTISELNNRTKALRESEEKLQAILNGIGDLITIQNKESDIIWVNQAIRDLLGDVIGKKCYKAYKRLDAPCPECTSETMLKEEKAVVSERFIILPDGRRINMLTTSSPVRDAEGNSIGIVEVLKDITELQKAEEAIKESEKRYRGLYESSKDGIVSLDMDGNIVECNQAYAAMLGYIKEELYQLTLLELTPSKWRDMNTKIVIDQVLTRGYSDEFEIERIKKDGTFIPVSVRIWLIKDKEGNPTGTWGIVRDITEHKKLERQLKDYTENLEKIVEEKIWELKESEERYRGLYESSIDGIASMDVEGNIVECNQAYVDMLGYTKEELYQLNYLDLIPTRWRDATSNLFIEQVFVRGYSVAFEVEHIKKNGTIFPISIRAWLIKDKDGLPTGMWTIVRDITGRKKLERQLKDYTRDLEESEGRYRGLYESCRDGIVIVGTEGNILECNQAFADMLDYTKAELCEITYQELMPSKWRDKYAKIINEQQLMGNYREEFEIEYIKKDGTIVSISARAWNIKDKEGNTIGTWVLVRDITERKQAEEALR
jgi:PAS domain S-box-containing protein